MNLFVINANALQIPLSDKSVNMVVTSPPYYGLRDYGIDNQIGLEQTPDEYVQKLVHVFREVWRVMKDDGTLWLNLGDSYTAGGSNRNGILSNNFNGGGNDSKRMYKHTQSVANIIVDTKPKDLIGIPWRVAFALQADGWYLRQDIIWHKPNPMPESVKDRCTKAHEYIFLLSKSQRYYYDADAIMEVATGFDGRKDTMFKGSEKYKDSGQTFAERGHERWRYKNLQTDGQQPNTLHIKRLEGEEYLSPVRNKRSVWTVTTKPYSGAHFATFPQDLIIDCIKAGSKPGGLVLDPFNGSGTTGEVCARLGRNYVGVELNREYIGLTNQRLMQYKIQPELI